MTQNFLDEYVKFASDLTDAPIDFHRFIGYSIVSTLINRRIFFPFGHKPIYPNLWIILLGASSLVRKTTSLEIGKSFVQDIDRSLIFPNEFSQEKIVEVLSRKPHGIFFYSEFMTLMGLLQKDYMAGAKAFLTDLYDCPRNYIRDTFKQTIEIKEPFLNIVSATTLEWFLEQIKEGDLAGGFLSRFIIIPGKRTSRYLALPPEEDLKERFKLIQLLKSTMAHRAGKIYFNPEALKAHSQWYMQYTESMALVDPRIHSFLIRLMQYVLKFSMLECVCKNEDSISLSSFNTAIQQVNWIKHHLCETAQTIQFTKESKYRYRILSMIKDHAAAGIERSDLLRNANISAKELSGILETLVQRNQIACRFIKRNGSFKASEHYFFMP